MKNKLDDYDLLLEKSALLRGRILNEVILLERMMDIYIAKYFCDDEDRQFELSKLILSTIRISYENKRQVLQYLIENKYGSKTYKEKFKGLLDTMHDIGTTRNKIAHHLLDTTIDGIKSASSKVSFLNMTHEITPKEFTDEGAKKFIDEIIECRDILIVLNTD